MAGVLQNGLTLDGVVKSFGATRALDDVSLSVAPGEMLSILGPSGCGKSTLLRVIAGFEEPDHGTIRIGDRPVVGVAPKDRELAFVFQTYALYPHLTAGQNLAAPLMMRGLAYWQRNGLARLVSGRTRASWVAIDARVQAMAELLEIGPLLDRKPGALSGGQRQRVALGRALIREPELFLLDEPLANLDAGLRVQTRSELSAIHRRTGATTLFVTHDQSEAMAISDRIAVMFGGRIRQVATPDALYRHPVDLEVARFLSQPHLNVVPAGMLRRSGLAGIGPGQVVAFRPEACSLAGDEDRNGLPVVVDRAEHAGAEAFVFVRVSGLAGPCVVRVPSADLARWGQGVRATLRVDPERIWLFPAERPVEVASVAQKVA